MTKYYEEYLKSDAWKEKRNNRLEIDGHKCSICGAKENLICHHITYNNLYEENENDLMTLCKNCHRIEHKNKKIRSTIPLMEMSYENYIKTKNIILKHENEIKEFQEKIKKLGIMNIDEIIGCIGKLIIKLKSMRKINILFVFLRNNYNIHLVYRYKDNYAEKYNLLKWHIDNNFFNNFICYSENKDEIQEDWFCEKVQYIFRMLPDQLNRKKKLGYNLDSVDKEIIGEGKIKIRQKEKKKTKTST